MGQMVGVGERVEATAGELVAEAIHRGVPASELLALLRLPLGQVEEVARVHLERCGDTE